MVVHCPTLMIVFFNHVKMNRVGVTVIHTVAVTKYNNLFLLHVVERYKNVKLHLFCEPKPIFCT